MDERTVHVVALNGSPHRQGNTSTLMQWVLEGCVEAGADCRWIHVVDYDIGYCRGCFTCLRTGSCPLPDQFQLIRDRLLAADGIVIGSPVYEGHATALLQTFIDRLTLLNLYTNTFEGKRTVGVATSGVAPTRGVAKSLAGLFGRPSGTIGATTATIAHGYRPLAATHDRRLPARARRLGRRLVSDIRSPAGRPMLSPFHIWIAILRRLVVQPLVLNNPDQFAGVIRIWREQGRLARTGQGETASAS